MNTIVVLDFLVDSDRKANNTKTTHTRRERHEKY